MVMIAFVGAAIHDGIKLHQSKMLLCEDDVVVAVKDLDELPSNCLVRQLDGGYLMPGFVDLQVNGGGGVMFNDDQSVAALATIARAHALTGTCALLPTLITDTPERSLAAIEAVASAIEKNLPGIIGIHLEGPHLSVSRKGAHDPHLVRPMSDQDLVMICDAAKRLPNVMLTVAPESVTRDQVAILNKAGVIVSLGHTDADYATCSGYFDDGALYHPSVQCHEPAWQSGTRPCGGHFG
jgi:N-acetylglucosamine-6-phosphate deacetylase